MDLPHRILQGAVKCIIFPRHAHTNPAGGDGMRMLSSEDRIKYEAARELGLLDKLKQVGWAGLSAAESGRVGGLVSARLRREKRPQ